MLEEELSMLGEGPVFKKGSFPLGEDLAAQEELRILEGSPQCIFFNICWTWQGLRFYVWKIKCCEAVPGNENNYYDRDEKTEELYL